MTQTKKTIANPMDTATTYLNKYRKDQLVADELSKHSGDVNELAEFYAQEARDARRKWIEATHPAEIKSIIGQDPREQYNYDLDLSDYPDEYEPWRAKYWNTISWQDDDPLGIWGIPILADIWNGYDDHYRLDLYFDANDIDVNNKKVVRRFLQIVKKKVDDGLEPLREAVRYDGPEFYGCVDKVTYRSIPDQGLVVFSAKGRQGLLLDHLPNNETRDAIKQVLSKSDYWIVHDSMNYIDHPFNNDWVVDCCTCPEQKLEPVTPADKWLENYVYDRVDFEDLIYGREDYAQGGYDGSLYSWLTCHNDHYYLVSYFDIDDDDAAALTTVEMVANIRSYLVGYKEAYDLCKPELKVQYIRKNRLLRIIASGKITPMITRAWADEL